MYVKRVILENLRGFERLKFDFERPGDKYAGWTVITGDNASGKTTLLKAIAAALVGPDALRALQPSFKGWIRKGCREATVSVEVVAGDCDRFAKGRKYEKPFWSELKWTENGGPEVSLTKIRKEAGKGLGPVHGPWADNPNGWFCTGYGPFRRLHGTSLGGQKLMLGPGRVARFATMFREDATLEECELWVKKLHHLKLEERQQETKLLEQVTQILDDDFLHHGLRIAKVDSQGVWLLHADNTVLPLADMSDGYRAALAMLIDLLRQLAEVYGPEGLVETRDGRVVVPHQGVVLIDEADSHLHPEWQRVLGFWFKQKFPSLQFIVTTHSPIICQAADEHGIFHLPPPGSGAEPFRLTDEDYRRIIASKPDAIYVSPAFNMQHTRSPRAVANRQRYSQLRSKDAAGALTPEERREKKQLKFWSDVPDSSAEAHA